MILLLCRPIAAALLISIRFLFGAAEAGAFPASARAIRSWLPAKETGIAQGILFSGSRLGAAFGLTVTSWITASFGWRWCFLALGALGIVWAVGWLLWFRNAPDEPVTVFEKNRSGDLFYWAPLMFQYFASNFTFFLCFSWLLPYLREHYRLSGSEAGLYAAVPLYFGTAANWTSGAIVDGLYRRGWDRLSRVLPAVAGFFLGAAALVAAAHAATVGGAVAGFAIATFGVDLTLSPSWTLCIDLAGDRAGTLSGAMNMFGNMGSFASSVAFPALFRWTGRADAYFYCAAVINVCAALAWIHMRRRKQKE